MILRRILVTEPCLCLAPSPSPLEREGMSKGTLISVSSGGMTALKATKERGPRGRAQLRGGVWEFWLCHVPLVPYRTCLQYVAVVGTIHTYMHACMCRGLGIRCPAGRGAELVSPPSGR